MNVNPVMLPSTPSLSPAADSSATSDKPGTGFAALVDQFLRPIVNQQAKADQAIMELAQGKTESLHGMMLEVSKAELSFRMVLETRNRLTDAFQEVMRMQI